jgi:ubiquinone/menaquinone biosynthesis C-methylase UbiE
VRVLQRDRSEKHVDNGLPETAAGERLLSREPRPGRGSRRTKKRLLPAYDSQLSHFHLAYEHELQQILDSLPLTPAMKVLDIACGNGFYTRRIAERLGPGGSVTGVDVNLAYLSEARRKAKLETGLTTIELVAASFDRLPFADDTFDFVWCAQSLHSLREPIAVLGHLARVLRPNGIVAVLENDTMHQVLLPWPPQLELPLRAAELRALSADTRDPSKYYVGRRLPVVLAAAGLVPLKVTTRAIDRQAPFGEPERALLQSYLEQAERRVAPYLEPLLLRELRRLCDPRSTDHILRQPYLTMTWLNVLALARKRTH